MFIDELKRFQAEGSPIEELVAASALSQATLARFKDLQLPQPEWLVDADRSVTREINGRRRDMLAKRAKVLQGQLESMKPAEVKQQELQAELDAILAALA